MARPTDQPIIQIADFHMEFGHNTVIEDLSFDVRRGETFGFLGSNGSGKTTTIRALLGIYRPTKGRLLVNGLSYHPGMSNILGYLPEERGLYKKESVLATMTFFGQLKQMSVPDARRWSLNYLERVGLGDKAQTPLEKLSGGQQQKIQVGVTIMNNPELLILDEPTKGFDPVNRRLLMDIVEEHSQQGATVVLVTHQMEEVERLCDRILLLKDGRRHLYGAVDDIRAEHGTNIIEVEFDGTLKPDKRYLIKTQTKRSARLIPATDTPPAEIVRHLAVQPDLNLYRFEVMRGSLDDIFIDIYSHSATTSNHS